MTSKLSVDHLVLIVADVDFVPFAHVRLGRSFHDHPVHKTCRAVADVCDLLAE